jgi:hypothetical protein
LAFGKADKWTRSLDQRVGELAHKLVISGLASEGNSVALRLRAITPSIENSQYDRSRSFCHDFAAHSLSKSC